MKRICQIGLVLIFALSCNKDDNRDKDDSIKQGNENVIRQGNGNVWISGGLMHCATQIHLDNGDTLIVNFEDIISFMSEDKVNVRYKETGINEFCPPFIDCEIIEIKRVE